MRDRITVVDDQIGGPTCARDMQRRVSLLQSSLLKIGINRGFITIVVNLMSAGVSLQMLYLNRWAAKRLPAQFQPLNIPHPQYVH